MALLTAQRMTRAGLDATENSVSSSDSFANSGETFIYVDNQNAGTCTVTLVTTATLDGEAVADKTVAILTTEKRFIGPFPTAYYNDSNGRVTVNFSLTSSVTCAVVNWR